MLTTKYKFIISAVLPPFRLSNPSSSFLSTIPTLSATVTTYNYRNHSQTHSVPVANWTRDWPYPNWPPSFSVSRSGCCPHCPCHRRSTTCPERPSGNWNNNNIVFWEAKTQWLVKTGTAGIWKCGETQTQIVYFRMAPSNQPSLATCPERREQEICYVKKF